MWTKIILCVSTIFTLVVADQKQDAKILEMCLLQISTPDNLEAHLEMLTNYANWTKEEIPCLTRCMAYEKGWYDLEANKWRKQRLVDELGADMYNYCRYDLDRKYQDACVYAHRGFRCLKQAELHASATYLTLLQCARQLNASNEQLLEYTQLKPKEAVPCLFECFANKMHFYDAAGNWQLSNWLKAFGPLKNENIDFKMCNLSEERKRQILRCEWMYEEYLCWERVNENSMPDNEKTNLTKSTTTTTLRSIMTEHLRV